MGSLPTPVKLPVETVEKPQNSQYPEAKLVDDLEATGWFFNSLVRSNHLEKVRLLPSRELYQASGFRFSEELHPAGFC